MRVFFSDESANNKQENNHNNDRKPLSPEQMKAVVGAGDGNPETQLPEIFD